MYVSKHVPGMYSIRFGGGSWSRLLVLLRLPVLWPVLWPVPWLDEVGVVCPLLLLERRSVELRRAREGAVGRPDREHVRATFAPLDPASSTDHEELDHEVSMD